MSSSTRQPGGADDLRAAVVALDELAAAVQDLEAAKTRVRRATLAAKATPHVTAEKIAEVLGTTRRNVYKRLAQ